MSISLSQRLWTLLLSGLIGAGWLVTIGITVGMAGSLSTGQGLSPNLFFFAVWGFFIGAAFMLGSEKTGLQTLSTTRVLLVGFFVGMVLTFAGTFGDKAGVRILAFASMLTFAAWALAMKITLGKLTIWNSNRFIREQALMNFLRGFGMVFFAVAVFLPLFVLVMTSFKSQQQLMLNPLDLSPDFSQGFSGLFRSYIELFQIYNFGTYLWNSTLISVLTVIITLAVAIPGAYAVSRLNFAGRAAMSRSILMIYLVPAIVLVIPLYAIFSQLGLRDSIWGLLIVYPATTLPVALYMLQGYFRGMPRELEEAGMMDGCSRLRVIWSITLPLALPALASVGLYVFMIAWNEFLFAFMFLDDPNMFTLSRGVVSLNSSEVPRQHLMAGAVVSTVPIVVIFLYAERFMVQGLTSGGVKG